jgi:subtilisin-like proprotein convertase family protein
MDETHMEGAMRAIISFFTAALVAGCWSSLKAEGDSASDTTADVVEDTGTGAEDTPPDTVREDTPPDTAVDTAVDTAADTAADTAVDTAVDDPVEEEPACNPTTWFSFASTDTPRAIPDDYDPGITSSITVTGCPIDVGDVEVTLDISHPFRGDLVVSLESPTHDTILLHDSTGGTEDDLRTTYPTYTAPAQSICLMVPTGGIGTWTLTVSDDAPSDTGTLNSWSLRLREASGYCPEDYYDSTDSFPMYIPDNNVTGVRSRITVPVHGSVTSVAVLVEVSHEYIGDVFIELGSPAGTYATLYDRAGGWDDEDLSALFPGDMTPVDSLARFNGEDMHGTWTLHVSDLESYYSGTLDGWRLHVE